MFNIGPGELIMIAIVVILFVPAKKIPEMATSLGRFIGNLQNSLRDFQKNMRVSIKPELPDELKITDHDDH